MQKYHEVKFLINKILRDKIEKESFNKNMKKKKQITIKNKDKVWHKNKIKSNVNGWNWKKNSTKKRIQNKTNSNKKT